MRLILLVVGCLIAFACAQSYPPAGIYASLAESGVDTIAQSITADVNSYIAKYVVPPINGTSSSGTYTFWSFTVQVEVADFTYASGSPNDFAFGWNSLEFYLEWNYHICANDVLHPCEDGNIYVYTPNYNQKTITADATLTLSNAQGAFTLNSVSLNAEDGDIMIWVFCTNTICLIPQSDIADAVAKEFLPTFTKIFTDAVDDVAAKYIDSLVMDFTVKVGDYGSIQFEEGSAWFVNPVHTTITPGVIVSPQGAIYADPNGQVTPPPFSPTVAPPDAALQSPSSGLDIFLTEYLFSSLIWALGDIGYFTKELTEAQVPSASPVKLMTNDSFFQGAVPGLTAYPNMLIKVDMKLNSFARTTVDTAGIHLTGNSLAMLFTVYNASTSVPGWSIDVDLDVDVAVNVTLASGELAFSPVLTNFNPAITIVQSSLGNISSDSFVALFQLLEGVITLPTFHIKLPAAIQATSVTSSFQSGYLQVGVNYNFNPPTIERMPIGRPNKNPPQSGTFRGMTQLKVEH